MFNISEHYLEDEVRDGFYIPSIAKRAWAAELSLLDELNRICDKYNIRYFADWGSLLGAIRHRGFIPWDDDLDVCMFRSDLNRFLEVADKELSGGFCIQSFENNDYSWKFIVNLVNTERMNFTKEYLERHYNFPYMATIDIFVIDNITDDEEIEEVRREDVKFTLSVADSITEDNYRTKDVRALLTDVERRSRVRINGSLEFIEIKRQLYRAVLAMITTLEGTDSEYVVQQIPWGIYHSKRMRRDYFDGTLKVPFENTYIRVPKRYDMLLRYKYGRYWEIRMGVGGHGYPYYNAQKEALGLPEDADYVARYKYKGLTDLSRRRETENGIEEFINSKEYNGEFDRETVVFLPFKGEYWTSLQPYYEKELGNENVDVFVVPLPYYYKEYNGKLIDEPQYDLETYPEDIPLYLVDELDLEAMFPDRIYIQNPYDEFNMCMSVSPLYYASNIVNLTKKLIYIPWFETADFDDNNYPQNYNMRYYCDMPGVIYADEVILSSKTKKDRYVDKLCKFAGEDTKSIWENKITVYEKKSVSQAVNKKTLVYYTSPSRILEYGSKYIEKIEKNFGVFESNANDLDVIWHFDANEMDIIKEFDKKIYEKIFELRNKSEGISNITIDENLSGLELAKECSAYYGDPSHIMKDFFFEKKPIMIADV